MSAGPFASLLTKRLFGISRAMGRAKGFEDFRLVGRERTVWGAAPLGAPVRAADEPPLAPRTHENAGAHHETASTRAHILDTAERHFAEHGFAGVTMRNIAMDANLKNQASLYHHFRSKRALYEAVLARGVEPIVALLAESLQATPPPSADAAQRRRVIDTTLDRLLDYIMEHPHLPGLIQRAGLDDTQHLPGTIPELLVPLYEAGLRALAGASTRWETCDLPHLGFGIYHLIFGYFANAALLETLLPAATRGAEGVARQRRFVKAAVAQLLGVAPEA